MPDYARRYRERDDLLSPRRRAILAKLLQPRTTEEREILERNKVLRTDAQMRKTTFIGMELSIPYRHLQAIKHMIPELRDQNPDRESKRKAWNRFLGDPLCRPYKVR